MKGLSCEPGDGDGLICSRAALVKGEIGASSAINVVGAVISKSGWSSAGDTCSASVDASAASVSCLLSARGTSFDAERDGGAD